jgi:acyl carrier protein
MNREEIKKSVRTIIANQRDKKEDDIPDDVSLEDLGVDSLDRVEIIMRIEEDLVIEIDDAKAEQLRTINEFVDYIASQKTS